MGDVIQFPLNHQAKPDEVEAALKEALVQKGVSGDLLKFAMDRFQHHRERMEGAGQFEFALELPGSVSPEDAEGVKGQIESNVVEIVGELNALCYRFIAELVISELQVHQYEVSGI